MCPDCYSTVLAIGDVQDSFKLLDRVTCALIDVTDNNNFNNKSLLI